MGMQDHQRNKCVAIGSLFDPANASIWKCKALNASAKPVSPRKPLCGKVSPVVRRPVAPPTSRFTNKKDFLMQLAIEVQEPARLAKKLEPIGARIPGGSYGIPGTRIPSVGTPGKPGATSRDRTIPM